MQVLKYNTWSGYFFPHKLFKYYHSGGMYICNVFFNFILFLRRYLLAV